MHKNNKDLNWKIYKKIKFNKEEALYIQSFIDETFLKGLLCGIIPGFILGIIMAVVAYNCG